MSMPPALRWRPEQAGRVGLAATGASIALTFVVAVAGTSLMEPPYPGRPGQPPWAFSAHLSPYLAVALTGVALAAGTTGLALTMSAMRRGWVISARHVLLAGLAAAAVLTLVPPFGSSDPLSYAAYGRMLVTGHNPYAIGPDVLARLGDPVARAVQDWYTTPSDYGTVATAGQAIASLIGGTSARLTVFVLSVLNLAAFAGTGVLLHRMGRGDRARQVRAALLWTCNPLLLQVLVSGEHVDSQAVFFGVAAVAVFVPVASGAVRGTRGLVLRSAGAGALVGLGFAVKVTIALIGAGLAVAAVQACWPGGPERSRWRRFAVMAAGRKAPVRQVPGREVPGRPVPGREVPGRETAGPERGGWRPLLLVALGLAAGFAVIAGTALGVGGRDGFRQTVQASSMVSFASPWRGIRAALGVGLGHATADDIVKTLAVILAVVLAVLLLRGLPGGFAWAGQRGGQQDGPINGTAPRGPDDLGDATGDEARPGEPTTAFISDGKNAGYGGDDLAMARPATDPAGAAALRGRTDPAGRAALAFALAWLLAWPYLLPWYDALAWALLPLVAASSLDWLLLARTAALTFGYLPARAAGIVIPADLGWLQTVVRKGLTPAVLAVVIIWLIVSLRRGRARSSAPSGPGGPVVTGGAGGAAEPAGREGPSEVAGSGRGGGPGAGDGRMAE